MAEDDGERFGPRMLALTEKQRAYVLAMMADPLGNPTRWARLAGYSDASGACKTRAAALTRDEAVLEAIQEECRRNMFSVGPVVGLGVMFQIARNPKHKDQLKAAMALANRAGFHETTEHKVTVEHVDDRKMLEIADRLAKELGVDRARLIGRNTLIEGEVVDGKAKEAAGVAEAEGELAGQVGVGAGEAEADHAGEGGREG